ncbi:MAG: hypothetical protein IJ518_03075 [Clostridia bacterium]|nr:hypothetical protein [Clostridia bacterium]
MKWGCVVLALCLLLTLTGCQTEPAESDPASRPDTPTADTNEALQNFSLAYSHEDTLNPYAAKTEVNLNLTGLLYDSLAVSDRAFAHRLSLASVVDTPDATHLVATLREGAVFSDGSAVTAADVVTSFKRAKASANYAPLLENMTAATANEKARQISFTLASPDVNALGCLTFPVIKASTLTEEAGKAPVGGGVYRYELTDTGARLVANSHSGSKPHYAVVGLRHLPDSSTLYYALSSGDIAYYFDDLDRGELPQVAGANTPVEMNALLFLGVNSTRGKLQDATVRQALSALLDRPAIVNTVYAGRGVASVQPFHPHWQPMAQLSQPSVARDLDAAVKLLEQAGCTAGTGGKRLALELIYCVDKADRGGVAELIRTQLEGAGVTATAVPLDKKTYLERLRKGEYDLYIGEIRLTQDMSLRPLLAGGKASYGVQRWGASANAYAAYLRGETTLEGFLQQFGADMPYIPLCWRSGFAAYDRRLTAVTPVGYDPYYGLADWQ